jgi:hypothetical protein
MKTFYLVTDALDEQAIAIAQASFFNFVNSCGLATPIHSKLWPKQDKHYSLLGVSVTKEMSFLTLTPGPFKPVENINTFII